MPPSMAVRTGVMPLKLDSGADSLEFDRARLLISSLREFWRGEQIFDLRVVMFDDEYEAACALLDLCSGSRLHVRIVVEGEFFSKDSLANASRINPLVLLSHNIFYAVLG
jgi:hypothetical protein